MRPEASEPTALTVLLGEKNRLAGPIREAGRVARTALQNAGSIASLMLTTEALIAEVPEEKKEPAMPHGGGGMGGMY